MLHIKTPPASMLGVQNIVGREETIVWRPLFWAVRQRISVILLLALIMMGAAGAYIVLRPAMYSAHTDLQLTNLKLTFSRDDALFAESLLDPSFLETQMQVMRSDKIALAILDRMKLGTGESPWGTGPFTRLRTILVDGGWLSAPRSSPAPDDLRRRAVRDLQRNYSVERVGMSNIVVIRVTAPEPEMAANLANELAQSYIDDQTAARAEIAQSASIWLRERMRDVGPKTRIIAAAMAPSEPSNAGGLLVVAFAGLAGAAAGVSLALARYCFDRSVRSPEQVVTATGAQCLGIIPSTRRLRNFMLTVKDASKFGSRSRKLDALLGDQSSLAARTLEHVRVAVDTAFPANTPRCIGVTSVFPGEGTSTIVLSFAFLLAKQGLRTLVIDCNNTYCGLNAKFHAETGDILNATVDKGCIELRNLVLPVGEERLHILSSNRASGVSRVIKQLWSSGMRRILADAARSYDYVLCDLPAMTEIAEVRRATKYVDGFVIVTEWGKTETGHLQAAVSSVDSLREKLMGVILNKVRLSELRWHDSPAASVLAHTLKRSRPRASDNAGDQSVTPRCDGFNFGIGSALQGPGQTKAA